ncbi:MAG: transglycosylase domain-containing protein, partial [Chloroflexi bacterium]|nr:transglycosylase domain-containing protein [Chloroflexota bacterium]
MARSSRNSGRRLRKPRSSFHLWPIFLSLMVLGVLGVGGAAAGVVGAYWYYSRDLPSPDVLAQRELTQSSKIYDRDGHLLYEVFDPQSGMRTAVPLSQISPHVIEATIATEDADFYNNPGINVRGIARVVWQNMTGREKLAGGGSSITQQLVKNVLIPERERSQRLVSRKIKEWILAFEITRLYNKDLILEWYLNEIYYGNFSYGIEAAAQRYFSKSAKDLTLAESAMLAGLPQAPSLYSPLTNSEAAKARQAVVLDLMVRQGYVAKEEAEAAKEEELTYATQSFTFEAPHFVNYIRDLLLEKYGPELVYRGGLKVTTTLDLNLQQEAEGIIREHLPKLENNNANNAALVSINPRTGEI